VLSLPLKVRIHKSEKVIKADGVFQAVIQQYKLDEDIMTLLEKMNGIYKFALSAETLQMVKTHRKTAQRMCQQTTECAIFIREYASHGFGKFLLFLSYIHFTFAHLISSAKRTLTAPIKGYKNKLVAYQAAFDNLRENFLDESALFTELTVFQISLKTENILSELKDICQ
jgi:hypothetical protein